jgi:KDO2-lipid IV(A) lauroyltransferase
MRKLRHLFEAAMFGLLLGVARVTPRGVMRATGRMLGRLSYLLDARHRRIAANNLRLAYGDRLSADEARRINRACWAHYGGITLETLAISRMSTADIGRSVFFEGLENIRAPIEQGRSALVFTGHFGHFELAGVMSGHLGLPIALVARKLDNPYLERMLVKRRSLSGNRVIHKGGAVRKIVKALREGVIVAIVIDQDARNRGIFVPFFGHPASTTPTMATLALRHDVPVVPCFCVAEGGGRYRIVYEPEVPHVKTGDPDEDVRRLTAECTAIIERWVRRYPEQWLWMHRRWKTQPQGRDDHPVE